MVEEQDSKDSMDQMNIISFNRTLQLWRFIIKI